MSKKKQNSIDSFVEQLKKQGLLIKEDSEFIVAYLEAKAMHKEEIETAWLNGMKGEMIAPLSIDKYKPEAEEYYNETYKNEK